MSKESTELTRKMNGKEFVISVQIDPPTSLDTSEFLHNTGRLRKLGVNLVDINSRTTLSYDSIGLAGVFCKEGFEVIPHITSRPSSALGLIDLVRTGYAFYGIKNYLVITGDPYRISQTHGVFETDSVGLLSVLHKHFRLEEGISDVAFAGSVNQNATDVTSEIVRILAKEQAGADFFMSQPVFNQRQAERLVNFYRKYSAKPLMVGIWPLIYSSMIEKIQAGDIKGVVIPDEIYYQSRDHIDQLREWGLAKAGYLIEDLKNNPAVCGIYIVAPARNPLHLTGLLERVLS